MDFFSLIKPIVDIVIYTNEILEDPMSALLEV